MDKNQEVLVNTMIIPLNSPSIDQDNDPLIQAFAKETGCSGAPLQGAIALLRFSRYWRKHEIKDLDANDLKDYFGRWLAETARTISNSELLARVTGVKQLLSYLSQKHSDSVNHIQTLHKVLHRRQDVKEWFALAKWERNMSRVSPLLLEYDLAPIESARTRKGFISYADWFHFKALQFQRRFSLQYLHEDLGENWGDQLEPFPIQKYLAFERKCMIYLLGVAKKVLLPRQEMYFSFGPLRENLLDQKELREEFYSISPSIPKKVKSQYFEDAVCEIVGLFGEFISGCLECSHNCYERSKERCEFVEKDHSILICEEIQPLGWEKPDTTKIDPEWVPLLLAQERLDQLIQAGYDAQHEKRDRECDALWYEAWTLLKSVLPKTCKNIETLDEIIPYFTQYPLNWVYDFEMSLTGRFSEDPMSRYQMRVEICRDFLELFPDNDPRHILRSLGEALFDAGQVSEGEQAFSTLVIKYPKFVWGTIGWADQYVWTRDQTVRDLKRAEELYLRALDILGEAQEYPEDDQLDDYGTIPDQDIETVIDRLSDIYEELGTSEKVEELLQKYDPGS